MSANSASGSKFYELISAQQDYIAQRSQNWLPSYSVITMTPTSFSIDTYQITDKGQAEAIDQTFTIRKTGESESTTTALTRAQAVERLYTYAGQSAAASDTGFTDVASDASYAKALAWAREKGIVKGVTGTTFQPNDTITQAQFAAMLVRYAAASGHTGYNASATLSQALSTAKAQGLLTGTAVTAGTVDYALTKLGK